MHEFLNRLSDEEFTELFEFIFELKKNETKLVNRDPENVVFEKKWGDGTDKFPYEWLETKYWFNDSTLQFNSDDAPVTNKHIKRLHKWMSEKFGKEYIKKLIQAYVGIEIDNWN